MLSMIRCGLKSGTILKQELEQAAKSVLDTPLVQKIAPIATTGIGGLALLNQFLAVIPGVLAIVATSVSISIALLIRKKTAKQNELLDIELKEKRNRRAGDED